jgi:hypothetical protein
MGIQNYRVFYSTNPSGFSNTLTNVVDITINIGRQRQLDQIKASTASVSMRFPAGYATPLPDLVTGSFLLISNYTNPSAPYNVWTGRITDVIASYGIPYQGGVGNADYLDISAEGNFAALGRMEGDDYAMAAGNIDTQISTAATQTGVSLSYLNLGTTTPLAATTITGTWGDWVASVCQTTNSRLWDGNTPSSSTILSPFYPAQSPVGFSDVQNGPQLYNKINFDSYADNFYNQVIVQPQSFSSATVTAAGATKPFRTYQTNTLNASTAQATDYANYLLNNYSEPKLGISSISCMGEAQTDFQLDKIGFNNDFGSGPGCRTYVSFRGTLYTCIIEGATMNATPFGSTFTYYLSDADMNSYLILNEVITGRLNENKLGY